MGTATYERKAHACIRATYTRATAPSLRLCTPWTVFFVGPPQCVPPALARPPFPFSLSLSLPLPLFLYLFIHLPSSSSLCPTVLVHVVRVERVRVQHTSLTTVNAPNFRKRLHFRDVYDGETVSARPDSRGAKRRKGTNARPSL